MAAESLVQIVASSNLAYSCRLGVCAKENRAARFIECTSR